MKLCCDKCFGDRHLKRRIQEARGSGSCDYCGHGRRVLSPSELQSLFTPLLECFTEVPQSNLGRPAAHGAIPLGQLLNKEWGVFNSKLVATVRDDLLCSILNNAACPGGTCRAHARCWLPAATDLWSEFESRIRFGRRFVLTTKSPPAEDDPADPLSWLPEVAQAAAQRQLPAGKDVLIYRAVRQHWTNSIAKTSPPDPARDLGPPPFGRAPAGRANPAGIPMLYGALATKTAEAELRPVLGECLWVGVWRPARPLAVVDLTLPRFQTSPFEDSGVGMRAARLRFLRRLSRELSRPVDAGDPPAEYVPTQYCAEVLRAHDLDGIIYGSAQHKDGRSVVIFLPSPGSPTQAGTYPSTNGIVEFTDEFYAARLTKVDYHCSRDTKAAP